MKKYYKVDEQGFYTDYELITDLTQLMIPNPDNTPEVQDSEGNVVKEAVTLESIQDPSYVDPEVYPIPAGIHMPKYDFENQSWTEGKVYDQNDIENAIEAKRIALNLKCRTLLEDGFEFEGNRFTYKVDPDQVNVLKADRMFQKDPTRIQPWRTADETTVTFDSAAFERFVAAIETHEQYLGVCWNLKDQLMVLKDDPDTTMADVEAITWD